MVKVIYEDNHLLVLLKPPHLPTQPSPHGGESLESQGKLFLKKKYHKPGNVYLHPIHRLDGPVSGIVVFSKTSKALSRLQHSIRQHHTQKIYLAWVEGELFEESGQLEDYLIHGDYRALKSSAQDKGAKLCLLSYQVIRRYKGATLVKIDLKTGRYHQIRAQFALKGHPIVGDSKYGSIRPYPHIALHHASFSIPHPITGFLMTFTSPENDAFINLTPV